MPERHSRKPTRPGDEALPHRTARRIRRRDKIELTIAVLLLASLLGLLVLGVARDDPPAARPAASPPLALGRRTRGSRPRRR